MCNKSGQFRQSIKLIQLDPALIYARIEIKHIDQNPISLAPSLKGYQGHLLAKACVFPCKGGYSTDAQERWKLLHLSPLEWGNGEKRGKLWKHV